MKKVAVFMADGCEEIEGLTVVDLLRRAKIGVDMVSITGSRTVTGSHGIAFQADVAAEAADWSAYDGVVLPGGMPGTTHLKEHPVVRRVVREFFDGGKLTAAICAAPTVLGDLGILKGLRATCYPGLEGQLTGASVETAEPVVVDGHVITSRGVGTAIPFALDLAAYLESREASRTLAESIVFRR